MMVLLEHKRPCMYKYYPDCYGEMPARAGMIIGRDERKDLCRIVDDESIFQRPFDIHKLYVTERKKDE